ncbi:MAG: hypothetical protein R3E31_11820 [Chloroflexota bacterium]
MSATTELSATTTVLATSRDFAAFLLDTANPDYQSVGDDTFVNGLYRRPGFPQQFIISAIGLGEFGAYRQFYFVYEMATGELSLLFDSDSTSSTPPLLTGNGRFLSTLSIDSANVTLYVHDLEEAKTTTYAASIAQYPLPVYDWSADDQWLVMTEDRVLRFIAPAVNEEHRVHNPPGCYTAVWVNKEK